MIAKRDIYKSFWLLVLFLLFIAPALLMFLRSLSPGAAWPDLFSGELDFRAWQVIFGDTNIINALINTVLIGAAVVLVNFLLAVPAAYGVARFNFWGKPLIESVMMMPILIPVLAIAMGMHITMIRLGLTDTMTGVILIHLMPTLPYAIRVMKSGFDRLSITWEEQSAVLGVGRFRTFFTTLIPLLLPSIRSMAVLVFVISLSQYVLTSIIGGGQVSTLPLIYYPYFNSADSAVVAGFSVVFVMLPVLFFLVFEALIRLYLSAVRSA